MDIGISKQYLGAILNLYINTFTLLLFKQLVFIKSIRNGVFCIS